MADDSILAELQRLHGTGEPVTVVGRHPTCFCANLEFRDGCFHARDHIDHLTFLPEHVAIIKTTRELHRGKPPDEFTAIFLSEYSEKHPRAAQSNKPIAFDAPARAPRRET